MRPDVTPHPDASDGGPSLLSDAKNTHRESTLDQSSDPRFVEYYATESKSERTHARFRGVRDRALALLEPGTADRGPLDVVDVGCGTGTQAMLWAELGHRVTALDISEPLVRLGRERAAAAGLRVRFEVGSATELPLPDASADVCLLPELLEHVADWEACLREAIRLLRSGGLLYLSTTNRLCPRQQEFSLPLYSWYPAALKRRCEKLAVTTRSQWVNHARYPAVNWFTYFELRNYLAARGFDCMDKFDMLAHAPLPRHKAFIAGCIRTLLPLRWCAHVLSEGTVVWALKRQLR